MSTDKATTSGTNYTETELKAMKRTQLWQLFTKLGLGVTREKNTGWLVEKILAAQGGAAEPGTPVAEAPAAELVAEVDATAHETVVDAAQPEAALADADGANDGAPATDDNDDRGAKDDTAAAEGATEPAADDAPANTEPGAAHEPLESAAPATAAPDAAQEALPAHDADAGAEAPTEPATDADCLPDGDGLASGDAEDTSAADRKLSQLTTDELRAKYLEVVGRPTGSDNRAYLIWKINEARKGRVPVGPVQRQAKRDADVKMMVLPLRMAEPDVEAIDAAWKRLGFKSRMAFIREAMGLVLEARGEGEAATAARNG